MQLGKTRILHWLALLLLAAPVAGQADDRSEWYFDADLSRIDFRLSAVGVIRLAGRFDRFFGSVEIDPEALHVRRVHLQVEAQSLHMDNTRHRDWARSDEFFDAQRHPHIEFRSDPLSPDLLATGGPLRGRLRVRGIERPARFDVRPGDCTESAESCDIEVTGSIRRSHYGMNSRRVTLSDHVHLHMRFRMLSATATEASNPIQEQ